MIEQLYILLQKEFTDDVFKKIKTYKGKTQESESVYMRYVSNCLNKLNIKYEIASSQQAIDFRLSDGTLLEVKKSGTKVIKMNDSYPRPNFNLHLNEFL